MNLNNEIDLLSFLFQTEEDRPTFRPFTRESLAQIEARIQEEEEKKRELEKKRQEGEVRLREGDKQMIRGEIYPTNRVSPVSSPPNSKGKGSLS